MDAHRLLLLVDAAIGGGPDGNMVDVHAVIFEHLLHSDADRRAAAPEGDQEGGSEATA